MKINVTSTKKHCSVYADKTNGTSVAGTEAWSRSQNKWVIGEIWVQPNERNRGIGTKLLNKLICAIKKQGGKEIFVIPGGFHDSNPKGLIRFYTRFGFKRSNPKELHLLFE
jgi:GNAT superfamily N-acetyltransferase